MPVVYDVPALIKHPLFALPAHAFKHPFPKYGVPVGVDDAPFEVEVAGRYFGR